MPQADIPFIIGVIREKEKGLLENDEYTRILGAGSAADAAHALSDTAYGIYLAGASGPLVAISDRLVEEFEWLVDVLGKNHDAVTFIAARFDALHIAAALIDAHEQSERGSHVRNLGTMSAELITSCLGENVGWESVPEAWRAFLRNESEQLVGSKKKSDIIERTKQHMLKVMETHATAELSRAILALIVRRLTEEENVRPHTLPDDLIQFERMWDEELLQLTRAWKSDATSINAVIAWWYALATEAKVVRLILSAKMGGFSVDTLERLRRSLYQSWV